MGKNRVMLLLVECLRESNVLLHHQLNGERESRAAKRLAREDSLARFLAILPTILPVILGQDSSAPHSHADPAGTSSRPPEGEDLASMVRWVLGSLSRGQRSAIWETMSEDQRSAFGQIYAFLSEHPAGISSVSKDASSGAGVNALAPIVKELFRTLNEAQLDKLASTFSVEQRILFMEAARIVQGMDAAEAKPQGADGDKGSGGASAPS